MAVSCSATRLGTALCAALTAGALGADATAPLARDQAVFRASVQLVRVAASVQHRDRTKPVPPLTPADFRIYEDGVEQRVTLVTRQPQPVSLCLAYDTSGSMVGRRRELAAEAVRTVFSALEESDDVSLVVFAGGVTVPVRWTSPSALPGLDWAQWVLPDDTTLLDGVQTSLRLMDDARRPQRVVLVISDGLEIASDTPLGVLVSTRVQSEVEIYAFRADPPTDVRGRFPRDLAEHLAAGIVPYDYLGTIVGDSGGVSYRITESADVVAATAALITDLRSKYTVGYTSSKPPDGTYRRIRVEPVNPELRVRHRGGYLAMPPGAASP